MFKNRQEAGRKLAELVAKRSLVDPVVYALPRGGVPVAAEIAGRLHCPLSLVLVRKIGVPYQPELAMGAVVDGEEPVIIRNDDVIRSCGVDDVVFDQLAKTQLAEIERRRKIYFAGAAPVSATGRSALLVDDGLATGATARAAIKALRRQKPESIGLLVPVAPIEVLREFESEVDWVICICAARVFSGVGAFYDDFAQLNDDEVVSLLSSSPSSDGGRS